MISRCGNCGQAALDNDKVCWHCGRPLAGHDVEAPDKVSVNEGWQQTQSLGAIGGYVAVAVFVVIAAVLITRQLGQQPLVSANVGERAADGWETIMDFRATFSFYLPQNWSWFEQARRERRSDPALGELVEASEIFRLGTHPFGAEVDDIEIAFLAMPISDTAEFEGEAAVIQALTTADAFMLVANSRLLNDLTYEETVLFLLGSEYRILGAEQVEGIDSSFIAVHVETPVTDGENFEYLRCSQQFFLGQEESMLVTLCAKNTVYTTYQRMFNDILTSFHRLS
jgi:hypothetical protein